MGDWLLSFFVCTRF